MLTLTGDILNWLAAGVAFPLMFLPMAALFTGASATSTRAASTGVFLVIVAGIVIAGASFAALTPILRVTPSLEQTLIFTGLTLAVAAVVFLSGGARALIERIAPPIEAVTRGAGRGVMWLLLAMALTQFAVVILRYVFGINSIFMQESITYMHGAVFLLAAGYALLTNDHVRVDILYSGASPHRKALIDFVGAYVFLFPICLLLLWSASPYVAQSWAVSEGSAETSGIQGVFILKSLIPGFAILVSMAGFVLASRASAALRGAR